jgi:hypothetical protein
LRYRLLGVLVFACVLAAVAGASEADALRIEQQLLDHHVPYGAILDPVFAGASSDEIAGYSRCGDSAIWTGHYLAASAFRYAATKAPDALDHVRATLDGIRKLVDVTGTDLLARCAFPSDSPYGAGMSSEESSHGVYNGLVDGRQWIWIGQTSRDQYAGVFFGLTAVYNLVPDAGIQQTVRELTTRLLAALIDHKWFVVMPDGAISTTYLGRADHQLAPIRRSASRSRRRRWRRLRWR